jgi:cation diffusion facilitator family transporter
MTNTLPTDRSFLKRYAWLSIGAAVLTILLKTAAYFLTGSVGLLSDALESLVNLAGGIMALAMLTVAARPEDESHAFGHSKAEYFSSAFEGGLILIAAASIALTAMERLISPQPLEQVGIGLAVSLTASLINLGTALILRRAGRRYHSVTLRANAQHLMTDVVTSAGVLVGVALVALTGWERLDPIVALLVAANIIWTGVRILRGAIAGLMDSSLPPEDLAAVQAALERHREGGIQYHALRTRESGARQFVSLHLLVPGRWTVDRGHQLAEAIEADLRGVLSNATVFTHLESLDDPASWDDQSLDRTAAPAAAPVSGGPGDTV